MIFTGGGGQRKRNVDATITKGVFTRYRFEWLGSMGFRTGVDSGEQRGGWRTGRDLNDARAANERGRTVEERVREVEAPEEQEACKGESVWGKGKKKRVQKERNKEEKKKKKRQQTNE